MNNSDYSLRLVARCTLASSNTTGVARKPPYFLNWMVRGMLLSAMHREGVARLSGSRDVTVSEFAVAFPDSCKWLEVLPHTGMQSLASLLSQLGYDGRPEFLSMFTCLLLTRACQLNPKWYETNHIPLCQFRRTYRNRRGVHVVPARGVVLFSRAIDSV